MYFREYICFSSRTLNRLMRIRPGIRKLIWGYFILLHILVFGCMFGLLWWTIRLNRQFKSSNYLSLTSWFVYMCIRFFKKLFISIICLYLDKLCIACYKYCRISLVLRHWQSCKILWIFYNALLLMSMQCPYFVL